MKGLALVGVRDSSPRFIGVAEVVTQVEMHLDFRLSGQTNIHNLRLGLPSNR
jgi:hypothetical protein